jgi:hypothetical protein
VLGRLAKTAAEPGALPSLFNDLVDCFVAYRDQGGRRVVFTPGTSELIDLSRVVAADPEIRVDEPLAHAANASSARRAAAAVAKGKGDAAEFDKHVNGWTTRK